MWVLSRILKIDPSLYVLTTIKSWASNFDFYFLQTACEMIEGTF